MSPIKNAKLLILFEFLVEFRLYAVILVIYFASVTGSYALAMSVLSITMIAAALFEVPTGIFSDLIGRKYTVTLGAIASMLFVFFYALGGSFWILAIGAIFEGLSRALWSGNNDALLYDSLPHEQREELFNKFSGRSQSAGQAALAICAVLGGIIAIFSMSLVMWLTLIPQILAFIVTLFLVEPKLHSNKETNIYAHLFSSFNQFRHNYKLRLVSFASIIDFAFGETGFQFKPVFVNSLWPIWAVGLAQTFSFIGGSISFYFSGSVIKRFGEIRSLVYENIISRIIGVIALVFPTVLSPALLSVTSLMFGVTQVAKNSLMQKEFTNEQRATLGSINSLLASISFAIVSFILGFTADQIGPVKALLLINLVLFFPLYLYWKIFTHNKQP